MVGRLSKLEIVSVNTVAEIEEGVLFVDVYLERGVISFFLFFISLLSVTCCRFNNVFQY